MPSIAEKSMALDELSSYFPLTLPVPTPKTHPELLTINDVQREEDLLRNPASFRAWWTAIHNTREAFNAQLKAERRSNSVKDARTQLLGPLATPPARRSLQCLTYLYESALAQLPGSFKLWKSYLQMRMSYVLGSPIHKKRAGGRKKFPAMKDALEEEHDYSEEWDGGLDGVVGLEEWKSLVATYERALMWMPKLPRLWLMYFSIFSHPFCPPIISHTHARRTFDRALRTLPPSLHARIWMRYLLWAESRGGVTMVAVYRRYLTVDPSLTEHYASLLLNPSDSAPRPLEAAKLLLSLARRAARGEYVSPEGKSPYQLLGDFLDVVERFAEEVGLDANDTVESNAADARADAEAREKEKEEPASMVPPMPITTDGKPLPVYDEDEDPLSRRRLNIERIVRKDGLEVYKDQAGRLWTGLATYWIKRGEFDRAKTTFEAGIASVLTIRDFTQIFQAYTEFCESIISAMMESLENPDEDEDEEDIKGTEREVDIRMKEFDELINRRPFLLTTSSYDGTRTTFRNGRNEWHYGADDDEKVAETYTQALQTINPRKATGQSKATKVNFKTVEDLAEIWCEWAEMELRQENYDEAIRVMQRAAAIPKNTKVNYHDHLPVQARLFKSLKLWSFYVDLEESIGTVESAKAVYDKIMELKIANAQIIVNYAAFLEENGYWEDSFKVGYTERGTEVFTYPISFEIWNIYLSKFIRRYGGTKLERARDLFEQALEKCPPKAPPANYGLPATRPIYERAIEVLPAKQTAEMCLRTKFWTEWNSFEIETGSEDTFREMLRIKRSVQAQFNTEASYLACTNSEASPQPSDPMAAAEQQAGGTKGPSFVAAKKTALPRLDGSPTETPQTAKESEMNADEIQISDEEV
ncbi:hypothetical protein EDD16DRAFT_1590957 [Pisolithus croceorrhizus]|nr:hypothetical protein EDD16DRAFT_1590957 [Pisolithus croceorrhizus]